MSGQLRRWLRPQP